LLDEHVRTPSVSKSITCGTRSRCWRAVAVRCVRATRSASAKYESRRVTRS